MATVVELQTSSSRSLACTVHFVLKVKWIDSHSVLCKIVVAIFAVNIAAFKVIVEV